MHLGQWKKQLSDATLIEFAQAVAVCVAAGQTRSRIAMISARNMIKGDERGGRVAHGFPSRRWSLRVTAHGRFIYGTSNGCQLPFVLLPFRRGT